MTILVYDAQGAGCYGCPKKVIEQFCSKTLKCVTNVHILRELHFQFLADVYTYFQGVN